MKRIAVLIIALFSLSSLSAQHKFDTVYMVNNEVKVGSIKAIDDASISFVHKDETLVYTLKKSDISKIVFSSGRVENVTTTAATGPSNAAKNYADVDHHNKVAVMPFGYINSQQETNAEMGYKVQDECYTYLSSKAATLSIQDPSTTNALLGKANVTPENVRSFTMQELCNILGVEYLLRGTITTNLTSTTSSGNATYNQKDKSGSTDKSGSSSSKSSGSVYTSNSSSQNFQTAVLMEIYTDDGKKVFGQDRTSFWQTIDAYKSTIQYLLKKSPIYGR
jgi:TolB-like protein